MFAFIRWKSIGVRGQTNTRAKPQCQQSQDTAEEALNYMCMSYQAIFRKKQTVILQVFTRYKFFRNSDAKLCDSKVTVIRWQQKMERETSSWCVGAE